MNTIAVRAQKSVAPFVFYQNDTIETTGPVNGSLNIFEQP
jgi:hypothetical protein